MAWHSEWPLAAAVCAACFALTWQQVQYWRDSISLYEHAIDATSENYVARFNLASVLEKRGDLAGAVAQMRETVRIRPRFALAHATGPVARQMGQPEEALPELQTAMSLRPDLADVHIRLGSVLGTLGRNEEAAAAFAEGSACNLKMPMRITTSDRPCPGKAGCRMPRASSVRRWTCGPPMWKRTSIWESLSPDWEADQAIAQLSEAVRIKPDFIQKPARRSKI